MDDVSAETRPGQRAKREIIDAALARFAADGFAATSVQHIADDCSYSKSSVMYHFDSKERMLDDALTPALDALEHLLAQLPNAARSDRSAAEALLAQFVDFLITYRREAAIILIQGRSLRDIPVMARANALIGRVSDGICAATPDLSMRMRVGVGLSGAAFVLAAGSEYTSDTSLQPDDDVRAALLGVLSELFLLER